MHLKPLTITFIICVITFTFLVNAPSLHAKEWYKEHKVIAVYIYNLLKYVKWPDNREKEICIMGETLVEKTLEQISKKYGFKTRNITYKNNIQTCSILYISRNYDKNLSSQLAATKKYNVLTVSTKSKFVYKGGIVGLKENKDKISLEINYPLSIEYKLKIDPELLELAEIIK